MSKGLTVSAPLAASTPTVWLRAAGIVLAGSALIAVLWRRSQRSFSSALISATAGNLAILPGGALWMAIWTHASATTVLSLAVLPFLPGDALKVITAAALVFGLQRLRRSTV